MDPDAWRRFRSMRSRYRSCHAPLILSGAPSYPETVVRRTCFEMGATAGLSSSAKRIFREQHCWTSQQWHPQMTYSHFQNSFQRQHETVAAKKSAESLPIKTTSKQGERHGLLLKKMRVDVLPTFPACHKAASWMPRHENSPATIFAIMLRELKFCCPCMIACHNHVSAIGWGKCRISGK